MGMVLVGRLERLLEAMQQQTLVPGIDERVNGLRQHRRRPGIDRGGELGHGNQTIARQCRVDHLL